MNKTVLIWILVILLSIGASIGGFYGGKVYLSIAQAENNFYDSIDDEKELYRTIPSENKDKDLFSKSVKEDSESRVDKSMTFLLIGNDSRHGEVSRSDTILIGKYNHQKNKVLLISIPRDSYVNIPSKGYQKINHAYAFGGAALSSVTIEETLGVKLQHYVSVNFQGFIQVVDAIGGVPMYVEKDMYKGGSGEYAIDLKQGQQILNGHNALAYSRFRSDARGDFGRVDRQQKVIGAIAEKMKDPKQIAKATDFIDIMGENMKTDLSMDAINSYLMDLAKKPNFQVEFDTVAGKGGTGSDGVYYLYIPDDEKLRVADKFNNF